ncbi:unnamed protein product [Mytilus edulis]|uniref:Uncharacterized protein n=1 Tax=Mytilus edulis TaxID=6550 RepID=A0A8S3VK60_MYTED|nr:unnamed protein product [Mytilus edulis]
MYTERPTKQEDKMCTPGCCKPQCEERSNFNLSIGTTGCYKPQCTPGCYKPQCEERSNFNLSIGTPGCCKPQCTPGCYAASLNVKKDLTFNLSFCRHTLDATSLNAHLDAASLLINNVYKPLEEVAIHKQSQAHKLNNFRDKFEEMLQKVENQIDNAEKDYIVAYNQYEDCHINKSMLYNAHNEYIFQLRASNRSIDQFQIAIPQVLEELEEIYIDTSNTINVAIESHALLLLTKANEQHRRFEDLLQICRQVNPQLDISYFVNALNPECAKFELKHHKFHPVDSSENEDCTCLCQNQLIIDKSTDMALVEKRALLQREAAELTSYITQNQDISHSLVNICQR